MFKNKRKQSSNHPSFRGKPAVFFSSGGAYTGSLPTNDWCESPESSIGDFVWVYSRWVCFFKGGVLRISALPCTWRIMPVSNKWLVTPLYKPFRPFGRGTSRLSGLTNHGPWFLTTNIHWDDPPSIFWIVQLDVFIFPQISTFWGSKQKTETTPCFYFWVGKKSMGCGFLVSNVELRPSERI